VKNFPCNKKKNKQTKIVSTWACDVCAFLVVVTLMSYIAYCGFVSLDVHSTIPHYAQSLYPKSSFLVAI
jgi:hypothetical protein